MKRSLIIFFIFLLSISFGCSKEEVDEYAMITFLIGNVSKNNLVADIGEIIKENDVILTGVNSFCDLKIGGSMIRIKEKSKVLVSNLIRKGNLENTNLGLDIGKLLCKPKKLLKSESFIVKTPTAVAGVRGTKFVVETDRAKTTRLKVFDGKVKIVKRVKQFESSTEKILEAAPVIEQSQKVVITRNDVVKAEKAVSRAMGNNKEVTDSVIRSTLKNVSVKKTEVQTFAVEDFAKENREIIEVKKKPKALIRQIAKIVKQEREKPKPEGRLLITRYEIYYIKDGKILWEGKVITSPIKKEGKVYIASGKYVFCASPEGPIIWKEKLNNDGKFEIRGNRFVVFSGGQENSLDAKTGSRL